MPDLAGIPKRAVGILSPFFSCRSWVSEVLVAMPLFAGADDVRASDLVLAKIMGMLKNGIQT